MSLLLTRMLFLGLTFIFLIYLFFHTALDSRTTSVRELLRQLRAKRFTKANPKLAINVDVHNRPSAPSAHFQFVDGTDVRYCEISSFGGGCCCDREDIFPNLDYIVSSVNVTIPPHIFRCIFSPPISAAAIVTMM